MLVLAHSVFNAVKGLTAEQEQKERRAFRSVREWRSILEAAGFDDTWLYEMEPGDPTFDEMLCFAKHSLRREAWKALVPPPLEAAAPAPEVAMPALPPQLAAFLDAAPHTLLAVLQMGLGQMSELIPQGRAFCKGVAASLADERTALPAKLIDDFLEFMEDLVQRFLPQFEKVDLQQGGGALRDLIPRELLALVPALLRKAEAGRASSNERFAASMLKDAIAAFKAFFGQEEEKEAEKETSRAASSAAGNLDGRWTRASEQMKIRGDVCFWCDGQQTGFTRESPTAISMVSEGNTYQAVLLDDTLTWNDGDVWTRVTAAYSCREEAEDMLEELFVCFPQLRDKEYCASMGFDRRARGAIRDKMDTPIEDMALALAAVLDEAAFKKLQAAFREAQAAGRPPTAALIFGRDGENPWSRAMMALLGAPSVKFTPGQTVGLSFVGLADVVSMWRIAQARRSTAGSSKGGPSGVLTKAATLSGTLRSRVNGHMAGISNPLQELTIEEGKGYNIEGIAEVLDARFGYQSLTADYVEVTEILRSKYLKDGTLHLHGVDFRTQLMHRSHDPGSKLGRGMDNLRAGVLNKTRHLKIKYRSAETPDPESYVPKVNALLEMLRVSGVTESLHVDDGHYTWVKLPEWMQVEIIQIFGQSLETNVWYRFPYMQVIKTYFEVLLANTQIVAQRYGPTRAWLSGAFMMNIVPGVLMSFFAGQMQLMAMPILAMPPGAGYGAERDQSRLYEQLVVQFDGLVPNLQEVDPRLREVMHVVRGLCVIKAPTQKALTTTLLALAKVPGARVLEVSNQGHIQVRVLLRNKDEQLRRLREMQGCEVMLQFSYPTDGTPDAPGSRVALCVTVPFLLTTIRSCQRYGIEVQQVYDFWCG